MKKKFVLDFNKYHTLSCSSLAISERIICNMYWSIYLKIIVFIEGEGGRVEFKVPPFINNKLKRKIFSNSKSKKLLNMLSFIWEIIPKDLLKKEIVCLFLQNLVLSKEKQVMSWRKIFRLSNTDLKKYLDYCFFLNNFKKISLIKVNVYFISFKS